MAKISIIIPVYNVERYIVKCIESILKQTFHDFEIILVDDGSTDKSRDICEEYAVRDSRITVIHKKNEGPSAARNCGLERSKSEYIVFIDADDYVDKYYLEVLYQSMKDKDADFGICCETDVCEESNANFSEFNHLNILKKIEVISKSEAYKRMMRPGNVSICAWAKIYHRRLIQNVRYPVGEIYEDCNVIGKIVEGSQRIVYIPYAGYFYLVRHGSITHSDITLAHMASVDNAKKLLNLIKNRYPEIEDVARGYYLGEGIRLFGAMILKKEFEEECKYLRREILTEKTGFLKNSNMDFGMRSSIICLSIGTFFYKFMRKIYYRMIVPFQFI